MPYKVYYYKGKESTNALRTFNCDHPGQVLTIAADLETFEGVSKYRVFGMSNQRVFPRDFGHDMAKFPKWDKEYP